MSIHHPNPSTHHLDLHHFELSHAPHKESLYLAQTGVERLIANVGDYIFMQRIKAIIQPTVIEQTLGQALEICEYNCPESDHIPFDISQGDETIEPIVALVDACASDYMKKRVAPSTLPEENSHEQHHNETGSGAKKMRKAVNKMRLSLINPK